MPSSILRSRARTLVLTIVLVGSLAPVSSAVAMPDLVVTTVSKVPRSVKEGTAIRISDTVRNTGAVTARPSAVRYYLTRNVRASLAERARGAGNPRVALTDILLDGSRAVPTLRRGAMSVGTGRRGAIVRVPIGTPPGTYSLLACADDRGEVAERREPGNCRAAAGKVTIARLGRELRVDAFSDTAPTDPGYTARLETALGAASTGCVKPSPLRVPTLPVSLRSTKAWLTKTVGSRDMAKFQRSADYRSPKRLQNAAGAAILLGRPGAALAALLRAHELQPREASHLIAAASVASSIGRPRDALAMLDAAARLDDRDLPAMGISRHSIALATRGAALVSLGQYAAAEKSLNAALAAEPLLSEAAGSLATAKLCATSVSANTRGRAARAGSAKSALPAFQQALRRQAVAPPGMDISLGVAATIRSLPFPATVEEASGQPSYWTSLYRSEDSAQMANLTRRIQLKELLRTKPGLAIERTRQTGLLFPFSFNFVDPELAAIARREVAAKQEISTIASAFRVDDRQASDIASAECDGVPDPCYDLAYQRECTPRLKARHAQWYAAMVRAYAIAGEHVAMSSRRGSGVAANLGDADAYALAMAHVEMADSFYVRSYAQEAQVWTGTIARNKSTCLDDPPPSPAPNAVGEFAEGSAGPCPPNLKAINAVADLGGMTVKVKCDEVTVEGSLSESWITGFGEVTYNKNGQVTIVAGAKAEVGKGLKGDFKSALYITVSKNEIVDVGWKIGPSVTVGDGPVQFNPEGTMDLSFLPSSPPAEFPTYVDNA